VQASNGLLDASPEANTSQAQQDVCSPSKVSKQPKATKKVAKKSAVAKAAEPEADSTYASLNRADAGSLCALIWTSLV